MDYTIQRGKTIIIKSPKRVKQIGVEHIIYISYDSFLISIFLQNQKKPETIVGNLKEIEQELAGFRFKKINRNQLINLRHFRSYTLNDRTITMASDVVLSASRRRLLELKKYFRRAAQ